MNQYLLLLYDHFEIGKYIETTIEELAKLWNCSTRYAKTIVKKCEQNNWIEWQTKQGRGKKPHILLQLTKLEAIYIRFDELWQNGQFNKAFELLLHYDCLNNPVVEQWLNERYGFTNQDEHDIFRYPYWHVELNIDPINALSRHDMHFYNQVHEPLLIYCEKTKEIIPNLIFNYYSNDAKRWYFTLRKDIYFHDGSKLTSSDVVASLERAKHIVDIVHIQHIIATDAFHVEIILAEPNTLLPRALCKYRLSILPEKWINSNTKDYPIGCGPFQITDMNNQFMRFSVFPKYFKERPWIDQVEVIYTPEALHFGISPLPFATNVRQQKLIYQEEGAEFILLNAANGPLQNIRLRQALFEAINSESYCLVEEGETVAYSFFTAKKGNHLVKNELHQFQFPHLRIGVQQIRPGANHLREAQILSDFLTEHNISHELELPPIRAQADYIVSHYDVFVGGIALGSEPIISLVHAFESKQFALNAFTGTDDISNLIKRVKTIWDDEAALQYLQAAEDFMIHTFVLKFLTHRQHHFYIRDDSPFAGIAFDNHGKIDYRKIYK